MANFEKNVADERIAPGVAPAASRTRKPMPVGQRVLLGLLALVCVVLIGVSGANLADSLSASEGEGAGVASEGASGAKSTSSAAEKTSSETSLQDGSAAADDASGLSDAAAADGVSGSSVSVDTTSARETAGSKVSNGGSSGVASSSSASSNAAGSQGSSSSKPSSGGSSGNTAGGGQQTAVPNTVTVAVSVSSSAVGSPVSASSTLTFEKGATVYDALCGLGLSVNASSTAYGVYVSAIGGLAEKEHGGSSGWKYSVNGTYPGTSCSAYVLSDGDVVVWQYALSA